MSKITVNKKKDRVPRPLEVIDWLEKNRMTKKLCLYCGDKEPKNKKQYCSDECERHDSVWRFSN
jgi:hypothetical protein